MIFTQYNYSCIGIFNIEVQPEGEKFEKRDVNIAFFYKEKQKYYTITSRKKRRQIEGLVQAGYLSASKRRKLRIVFVNSLYCTRIVNFFKNIT